MFRATAGTLRASARAPASGVPRPPLYMAGYNGWGAQANQARDPRGKSVAEAAWVLTWGQMHDFATAAGRHEPMVRMLGDCGLRVGSCVALRRELQDLRRGVFEVRGSAWEGVIVESPETKEHERSGPIPPGCLARLRAPGTERLTVAVPHRDRRHVADQQLLPRCVDRPGARGSRMHAAGLPAQLQNLSAAGVDVADLADATAPRLRAGYRRSEAARHLSAGDNSPTSPNTTQAVSRTTTRALPRIPPATARTGSPGMGSRRRSRRSQSVPGRDGTITPYVSWRTGATSVAGWRVLAGPSAHSLAPVRQIPKRGFESAIPVHSGEPYFAVQALSSSGRVLASSRTTGRRRTLRSTGVARSSLPAAWAVFPSAAWPSGPVAPAPACGRATAACQQRSRTACRGGRGILYFRLSPAARKLLTGGCPNGRGGLWRARGEQASPG